MRTMWKPVFVILCVFAMVFVGCGSDDEDPRPVVVQPSADAGGDTSPGEPDTGIEDTTSEEDTTSSPDVSPSSDVSDTTDEPDTTDESDTTDEPDVTEDIAEDAIEDISSEPDATEDIAEDTRDGHDTGEVNDPYEGRPLGQCTQNSDCPVGPQGQLCSRAFPGGACQGCGSDAHCPSIASCFQGNCVGDCSNNDDCAPGLRCLASGRCAAIPCVEGVCPVALFECGPLDQCARASCSDGSVCPEETTCMNGLCIENRALNQ